MRTPSENGLAASGTFNLSSSSKTSRALCPVARISRSAAISCSWPFSRELIETFKAPAEQVVARVTKLMDDNKSLTKQLKTADRRGAGDTMTEAAKLLEQAEQIGGAMMIVGQLSDTSIEQARMAMDSLRMKAKSAVVVLGIADGDGKVTLLAGVTDDLIKKVRAGDIVKEIAPIVGGGGGGRPQMAQAGGKDPAKLPDAMEKAKAMIRAALA